MAERVDEREERNRGEFSGAPLREVKTAERRGEGRERVPSDAESDIHIGKASE